MSILSAKQYVDIWTQLDALLGSLAGVSYGGGVAPVWGGYDNTTTYTGPRVLTALQEAGGVFSQLAASAPTANLGELAAIVNLGFVELANSYVDYLAAGGESLAGIAKTRGGAPNPGQSYHDNILGNIRDVSVSDRFRDYNGPTLTFGNATTGFYTYDPTVENTGPDSSWARSEEAEEFGGERPYYGGFAAETEALFDKIGYDLTNGISPEQLDLSGLEGKYLVVQGTDVTAYNSLADAVAAAPEGALLIQPSGEIQTIQYGTAGAQVENGTAGDDIFFGSAGKDTINGGDGSDTFSFAPASSSGAYADLGSGLAFSGETGVDTLNSIENLIGTDGDDSFVGNGADNTFYASLGTDDVDGDTGSDTFDASYFGGDTTVDLGTGSASGYAAGATTVLVDIENAVTGGGDDTLIGTAADNVLVGNGGDDSFTGNGGSDVFQGGAGFDTVNYAGTLTADAFGLTATGGWTIEHTPGETDTLSEVESVSTSSGKFLLVGNGGYATIQEAINAAQDGDTVVIAEGLYIGDLTITDRAITLAGVGNVEIRGQISVDDDMLDSEVLTFKNLTVDGTGENYAIDLRIDAPTNGGKVVLDGVVVENARQNGLFYTNSLNASSPLSEATLGAIEIVNSTFENNGYIHTGSAGRGHINLFGFNGDVTVTESDFTSPVGAGDWNSSLPAGTVVNPHKAISISGVRDGTPGVGPYSEGGTITFEGVTISGDYSTDVLSVYSWSSADDISFTDVVIDARGPWGLVNFDSVGGEVDVSGIEGTNTFVSPTPGGVAYISTLQGLASADTLVGTDGADVLLGRGGADVLDGGAGSDLIIGGTIAADEGNTVVDTAVYAAGEIVWTGTGWTVVNGADVDTLVGIERVTIGSETFLLVDKTANGGFTTIQAAIDAAAGGETILISAGDYTELASYNPADNTNTLPGNPVGLLINKSVTLQGVDEDGPITSATDTVATIKPAAQSNWGTQIFVTAEDVSIIGLEIEALSTVGINKIIEVVEDNFTITGSKVGAADGADIGASIYVNDRVGSNDPGFVSDIETLTIDGNILEGDIAITSGTGLGHANPVLNITNNEFVLNEGADTFWNWGIIITGRDDAVAWRPADVAVPNVSGNTFSQDYTGDRILFVRGDNPAVLVDTADVEAFLANNDTGTFAYVTDGTDIQYIPMGTTQGFAIHRFAGNASADAVAGNTLVVNSGTNNDTQVITVDNLTVLALEGSEALNLELGAGVETITVADYAPGEGEDVRVTGNDLDNTITGNSGDNTITGGLGADALSGGDGSDTFLYSSAAEFAAGESVDGGAGLVDSIVFRPAASETLVLSGDVTGIEAVMIEGDAGTDAGVDASGVGNALAFFGDDGDNTFTGTAFTDSFDGGDGVDTVVENGTGTVSYGAGGWSLEGQTLTDIEIVDVDGAGGVRTLLVGDGGFATVQEAIEAASAGDTIRIGAGTFDSFTVSKDVTIIGQGEDTIIRGPLVVPDGYDDMFDYVATGPSVGLTGSTVITIASSGVVLQGLSVAGGNIGIGFSGSLSDVEIVDVSLTDVVTGIYKLGPSGGIDGLTITDVTVTDAYQGISIEKTTTGGDVTDLTVSGLTLEHVAGKGIYVETLKGDTSLTDLTFTDVGEFGRGASFGAPLGGWGAGIDINLKYGIYDGDITIDDFTFTNVGSSDQSGAAAAHLGGAAIAIKGRDDAPSYSSNPGVITGAVTVSNGTIDGTSTGIRLGEPNKPSAANNVSTPNVTVTSVVIENADFEVDNVSKAVLTITLAADDDNQYDAGNAATATGQIVFNGNALDNVFTGAKGNDIFNGNGGNDVFDGGDGDDTFRFTSSADAQAATLTGGDGVDIVVVDTVGETDIDLDGIILNGVERVVIEGDARNIDASDLTGMLGLVGNEGDNTFIGTQGATFVLGLEGNDTVQYTLGQGEDSFDGGADFDTLEFDGRSAASSTSYGLTAAGAFLSLTAGAATAQTLTNVEKVVLDLSDNGDRVTLSGDLAATGVVGAGSGITINTGAGNDVVNAAGIVGAANLVVDLGEGNNTFIGGRFDQTVTAGSGLQDMIDFSQVAGSVVFNLGTGQMSGPGIGGISTGNTGFEQVRGSAFNDVLNGSSSAAIDETFYASLGNDLINGRDGSDTYSATYVDPDGVKQSFGQALYVNLEDGVATDRATSSAFTHALVNIENVVGSAYDDWIIGDGGANIIDGEAGDDILQGGGGNDVYYANSAGDVVVEDAGGGIDTVYTSRGRTTDLWANVENLVMTGSGQSGNGNGLDNVITGNSARNLIDGKAGNDIIDGGAGYDVLTGGLGNDTFVFSDVSHTGVGSGNRDRIQDFVHGQDKIDISLLADTDFAFRGNSAFVAGDGPQVRWQAFGTQTVVQGDHNGDGVVDFEIQLNGGSLGLTSDDFLL